MRNQSNRNIAIVSRFLHFSISSLLFLWRSGQCTDLSGSNVKSGARSLGNTGTRDSKKGRARADEGRGTRGARKKRLLGHQSGFRESCLCLPPASLARRQLISKKRRPFTRFLKLITNLIKSSTLCFSPWLTERVFSPRGPGSSIAVTQLVPRNSRPVSFFPFCICTGWSNDTHLKRMSCTRIDFHCIKRIHRKISAVGAVNFDA